MNDDTPERIDEEIRAQLQDPGIRAKLAQLLKRTALIEHPHGIYPASIIVPPGLNAKGVMGLMARLGATPDPDNEKDKEKGFGQWSYSAGNDGTYERIYIKHPDALAEVRDMFGATKSNLGKGLALEIDLMDDISEALTQLRVGERGDKPR